MPRLPRLELPSVPLHVTQRGVNRCAIFVVDDDRHHYRRLLRNACRKHEVAVHAFVLMDNHVHLLLSAEAMGSISKALRQTGQTYVQSFNHRHGRIGTLWQSRFKPSLIDTNTYALHVIRGIELNPVRAAMAERPEHYRWSSVHTHLAVARDPLLSPHPIYLALGTNPIARSSAWRMWLHAPLAPEEVARIRSQMRQEKAIGDLSFHSMP